MLKDKMSESSESQRFPCPHCDRSYSRKHDMERHLYMSHTVTTDKPFRCEKCNLVFTSEETLKEHKTNHSEDARFQCELCEKTFKTSNSWKRHTRAHIDPKPFRCQICKRKFGRVHDMQRHVVRMHSGERQYKCDLCPSKFAWFSDLTIHKRRHNHMRKLRKGHESEAKGTISKKSKKKILFKNKKKEAQQTSSGEHVCKLCSLTFTCFSSLQLHTCASGSSAMEGKSLKNIASDPKTTNSCLHCERQFESFSALQFHSCDNKASSDNTENETTFADPLAQGGDSGGEEINNDENGCSNTIGSENALQSRDVGSSVLDISRTCSAENSEQCDEIEHVEYDESIIVQKTEAKSNESTRCDSPEKSWTTLSVPQHHSCEERNETSGDGSTKQNADSVAMPANDVPKVQNSEQSLIETRQSTAADPKSDVKSAKGAKSDDLKCKVCRKVFTKFTALQLHLCEESIEEDDFLELPMQNAEKSKRMSTRSNTATKKQTTPQKKQPKERKTISITRPKETEHSKGKAEDHTQGEKQIQPYSCESCSQKFKHKKNLIQHEQRHKHPEPTLICAFCSKGFFRKCDLERHVDQLHPVEAPYRCKLCEAAFTSEELLKKHMPDHAQTHPYVCWVCSRGLRTQSNLKRHLKMHLDERPYKCPVCNKGFNRRHDMYQHAKVHGTDRLTCDQCPRKFVTPMGLRKHRRKKHSAPNNLSDRIDR